MKLREEVALGRFTRDEVAASLYSIIAGKAKPPYDDPRRFFEYTYLTDSIKTVLKLVVDRLQGRGGNSVIIIESGFGGGKTHLLATLYYYLKHGDKARGTPIEKAVGDPPPETHLCVLDCTYVDPWKEPIWGWLARCLGREKDLAEYVKERRPPDAAKLEDLLPKGPLVLIIDEIGEYFRNIIAHSTASSEEKKSYAEGIKGFFRNLTEAMGSKHILVISIPDASAPYDDTTRRHIDDLKEILKRRGIIKTPVSKLEEIYGIIKRRLFEEIDAGKAEEAARRFREFYEKHAAFFKEEWTEITELRMAYPFHPSFIRVLYERTASIPEFQRTRDLIYVLARVSYLNKDVLRKPAADSVLMLGDVDLLDEDLKQFFTIGVGRPNFEAVIEHDIKMAKEKSPRDYSVAVALYVYSLIAGDVRKSAADRKTIRTLVARPRDVDPQIYDKTLDDLLNYSWYIDTDGERFWISAEPNLNKVLQEEATTVERSDALNFVTSELEHITETIREVLKGFEVRVVHNLDEVEDKKGYRFYILSPDKVFECNSEKLGEIKKRYETLTYKNSVYLLLFSESPIDSARYVIACERLKKRSLEKEARRRLEEICRNKMLEFYGVMFTGCNCLVYPAKEDLYAEPLSVQLSNSRDPIKARSDMVKNLAKSVIEVMQNRAKYMESLDAEFFYDTYIAPRLRNIERIDMVMILEDLYRDPDLPALGDVSSLYNALRKLADDGKIVLSCGGSYYWGPASEAPLGDLTKCVPERAQSLLKNPPEELIKAVEEAKKAIQTVEKTERPAVICEEVSWPGSLGFLGSSMSISGHSIDELKRFVTQLIELYKDIVKIHSVEASATLVEGDLSATWTAKGIGGLQKLIKYLSSVERGAEITYNVAIKGEFKMNEDLERLFKAHKGLSISVKGEKCK